MLLKADEGFRAQARRPRGRRRRRQARTRDRRVHRSLRKELAPLVLKRAQVPERRKLKVHGRRQSARCPARLPLRLCGLERGTKTQVLGHHLSPSPRARRHCRHARWPTASAACACNRLGKPCGLMRRHHDVRSLHCLSSVYATTNTTTLTDFVRASHFRLDVRLGCRRPPPPLAPLAA